MKEHLRKRILKAVLSIGLCLSLLCGMTGCVVDIEDGDTAFVEKKETRPNTETVKAEERKRLALLKLYCDGTVCQTYEMQYNEAGLLSGAVFIEPHDFGDYTANLSFKYDSAGRLLEADRDDFWLYFGNDEYEYNDLGQLVCHKFYWGGGKLPYRQTNYQYDAQGNLVGTANLSPDDESGTMRTSSVHAYTYLYDDQGRISERQGRVTWIDGDFNMVTDYGTYPYSEYVEVVRYKYDAEGRVITVYEDSIPEVCVNLQGNQHLLQDNSETMSYIYDFGQLVLTQYDNGNRTIHIYDCAGNEVWHQLIGSDDLVVDRDGYLIGITDQFGEYTYELFYSE